MDFMDEKCFRIGRNFGLEAEDVERVDALPPGLTTKNRVVEEVLETFVALHLERVTGLPLEYVCRGHRSWAGEDLVAWGRLGRVHLFELKKKTINEKVIGQLMQYAMRHMFRPVEAFVEKKWRHRSSTLGDALAMYLAGACANERTTKLGCAYVVENLPKELQATTGYQGDWPISQYWWDKQDRVKRDELLFESLLNAVRNPTSSEPAGFDTVSVRALANDWSTRLGERHRPPRPHLRATRPVVLWLVAPNVTGGAVEQVREWRGMGLDTRVVNVDLRKSREEVEFYASIQREDFAARDELERQLLDDPTIEPPLERIPQVELHFYESSSPSAAGHDDDGRPLDEPRARVEKIQQSEWTTISM